MDLLGRTVRGGILEGALQARMDFGRKFSLHDAGCTSPKAPFFRACPKAECLHGHGGHTLRAGR